MSWIVAQIGAREHYAIARALQRVEEHPSLITDLWSRPGGWWGRLPKMQRLQERWHPEMAEVPVVAPNAAMLAFELKQRMRGQTGWQLILARNRCFQKETLRMLNRRQASGRPTTLFSYSYAARHLFGWARERGVRTILGQIDPGPEEERIVQQECSRYPELATGWQPAPAVYWDGWREEIELADRIVVNSNWSQQALLKEGVDPGKIEILPLCYEPPETPPPENPELCPPKLRLLFLGQINLRKGIGRLLEAMRMLKQEPIELDLVGPSQVPVSAWADLPKVTWHGPVTRSEVTDYYQKADLLILPTLSDGFALTQLEALAHGLPLLVSRNCGEVVEPDVNGRFLANLEPATIADALLHWLNQPIQKPVPSSRGGLKDLEQLGERLVQIAARC